MFSQFFIRQEKRSFARKRNTKKSRNSFFFLYNNVASKNKVLEEFYLKDLKASKESL